MTAKAAKARAVVRLPDGRTGRLIYWPLPISARKDGPARHGTRGARARVQLWGNVVVSVDTDDVTVLPPLVHSFDKQPSGSSRGRTSPATSTERHPARSTNVQEMT
jgi:hypothetical protein